MKIFKWCIVCLVSGLMLWYLLLLVYFKSMSMPRDSFFYPSVETIASPYASLNAIGYTPELKEPVRLALKTFAHSHDMVIERASLIQTVELIVTLKRKDIRIKVVNINVEDDFLYVFLYKEESRVNLSKKEHRAFFDMLIEVFRDLNLKVTDIKFSM